jgi:hypothetical protein
MLVDDVLTSVSPVEVSGWDEDKLFFVEQSLLASDDRAGNLISLRHHLSSGSIVFLRLLNDVHSYSSLSIPYEAHFLGSDFHGFNQFSLTAANPRYSNSSCFVN